MNACRPTTQNLLSAAAVLGHHFEPDLLEEVADVDSETLTAALTKRSAPAS